eukprot:scaffold3163_cov60-Attheya_sp.AAC.11
MNLPIFLSYDCRMQVLQELCTSYRWFHSEFRIVNIQQEELLKEIKEELKEIKEQLRAITILLEKKSSCENDDENDKTKLTKKKSSSSITTAHQEACRSAHEWAEKRTLEKRTLKRTRKRDNAQSKQWINTDYIRQQTLATWTAVKMSHVMGVILIKLNKTRSSTTDEDDKKVLTQ